MRVLIIPEDARNDQFILKPLFKRLFLSVGRQAAKIQVCQEPRLRGVSQAMNNQNIAEIVRRYHGMIDLFVLCVDRDGNKERRRRLNQIEQKFDRKRCPFLAVEAWEELETWVLAGLGDLPSEWPWKKVRAEISVKEKYFDKLVKRRSFSATPGGGRKRLGEQAARNVKVIRQKCEEDFDRLVKRIEERLPRKSF